MIGLDLIMAAMLHAPPQKVEIRPVAAQVAPITSTQGQCSTAIAPKINVIPSNSNVRYDFTKSREQLNTVDIDTVSPYGPQHNTMVSGLMSGGIQLQNQMAFMYETYEEINQGCLYLKSIDVSIHIDPTIFIAREYPQGTCMHKAVMTHEKKHVREDQLIVNKYVNIIGQALLSMINSQKSGFGPYEKNRIPFIQENVQNSVNKVLTQYNDTMNQERRQRQQAIDNLEEYESIGTNCPEKHR